MPGYRELFPDDLDIDKLLTDGWPLASRSTFWAAHLLAQGFGEDEELILSTFGVSEEAARREYDDLSSPEAWPTFEVPLGNGQRIVVVYRNVEDDAGVDYLLDPGPDRPSIRLAALEGEYSGPGISLPELLRVAAVDAPVDSVQAAQRLVLLLPSAGDSAVGEDQMRLAVLERGSERRADLRWPV